MIKHQRNEGYNVVFLVVNFIGRIPIRTSITLNSQSSNLKQRSSCTTTSLGFFVFVFV